MCVWITCPNLGIARWKWKLFNASLDLSAGESWTLRQGRCEVFHQPFFYRIFFLLERVVLNCRRSPSKWYLQGVMLIPHKFWTSYLSLSAFWAASFLKNQFRGKGGYFPPKQLLFCSRVWCSWLGCWRGSSQLFFSWWQRKTSSLVWFCFEHLGLIFLPRKKKNTASGF